MQIIKNDDVETFLKTFLNAVLCNVLMQGTAFATLCLTILFPVENISNYKYLKERKTVNKPFENIYEYAS